MEMMYYSKTEMDMDTKAKESFREDGGIGIGAVISACVLATGNTIVVDEVTVLL